MSWPIFKRRICEFLGFLAVQALSCGAGVPPALREKGGMSLSPGRRAWEPGNATPFAKGSGSCHPTPLTYSHGLRVVPPSAVDLFARVRGRATQTPAMEMRAGRLRSGNGAVRDLYRKLRRDNAQDAMARMPGM
jgi:hypothetical protein